MQITMSEDCELSVLLWKKEGKLCIVIVRVYMMIFIVCYLLWFSINSHLFQKPKLMGIGEFNYLINILTGL